MSERFGDKEITIRNDGWFGECIVRFHEDGDVTLTDEDGDDICINRRCAVALADAIRAHFQGDAE